MTRAPKTSPTDWEHSTTTRHRRWNSAGDPTKGKASTTPKAPMPPRSSHSSVWEIKSTYASINASPPDITLSATIGRPLYLLSSARICSQSNCSRHIPQLCLGGFRGSRIVVAFPGGGHKGGAVVLGGPWPGQFVRAPWAVRSWMVGMQPEVTAAMRGVGA